jgi:hypothetical protein
MCRKAGRGEEGKYSEGGYKGLINFPGERENTFLPMKE